MDALPWIMLALLLLVGAGVILLLLRGRGDAGSVARFDAIARDLERLERGLRDDMGQARREQAEGSKGLREEVGVILRDVAELQKTTLEAMNLRIARLTETVGESLARIQQDNAAKLEQMRQTVDEKLQTTLEARLGQSFQLISERLERVHQGLGEMQTLASGVGDLKKVLTNVKTRGTWGEIQLGNLLEQMLAPEQFIANAAPREGSGERVEYVIRLPGAGDGKSEVWLPIDAKFPREDYERLLDAVERADPEAVEASIKALELQIRKFAKDIRDKYINPPRTTDFALLFLPTEGLYAEVLRRPGLVDQLQREYRVNLCGPTTLGALLNSLQMGFRTLAIQKRSSEVWEVLAAVKTEFGRFGEVLDRVHKKLGEATTTIEQVAVRKRAIDRKLRDVSALPAVEAQSLLDLPPPGEEVE